MSEIKYPYIGKSKLECVVLFFSKGTGFCLESGVDEEGYKKTHPDLNKTSSNWIEDNFKNITREYLTNTWGVVESEEHADFIVELAINAGFEVGLWHSNYYFTIYNDVLWFEDDEREASFKCKQITIPMPPKSDAKSDAKKESPELGEWPMVGDDVVLNGKHHIKLSTKASNHIGCKGVLKSRFKNNENEDVYVIEFPNLDCICVFLGSIEKPKTPEQELRDELIEYLNELGSSARYCFGGNELAADELLKTYNITKKHP